MDVLTAQRLDILEEKMGIIFNVVFKTLEKVNPEEHKKLLQENADKKG